MVEIFVVEDRLIREKYIGFLNKFYVIEVFRNEDIKK